MILTVRLSTQLDNFTLQTDLQAENEILVLFGPSGSGKSTLLKCIAGLVRPDEGFIQLKERVLFSSADKVSIEPRFRNVGYVPQDLALFPHMTVEQNVGFSLALKKKDERDAAKCGEIIKTMKISQLKDRYPRQLSGGEKQRVALARALITEPELLILDEPLSALDDETRFELQEELFKVQRRLNIPVVLVTHDYREVERFEASKAKLTIVDQVHLFTHRPKNRPQAKLISLNYK